MEMDMDDDPVAPEVDPAEQAMIDSQIAVGAAGRIREAAAYDETDETSGRRAHILALNSGANYSSMSQSYRDGSLAGLYRGTTQPVI